jgi:hypothetical protein
MLGETSRFHHLPQQVPVPLKNQNLVALQAWGEVHRQLAVVIRF